MTTGGAQFQQGEDFVAARLSIEIPTDGIASLRELTQEIERFRVGAESAGRAQDNFVQYLSQSAEAAERSSEAMDNLVAQMQRISELADMMGPGGFDVNVPQGYTDPFSGVEAGLGRAPSSTAEAQSQIDALRESDPRAYMNMQAARGNLRTGDIPAGSPDMAQLQEAANRVHVREAENARRLAQNPAAGPTPRGGGGILGGLTMGAAGVGLAHQVMNEMGSGEGGGGLGALLGAGSVGGAVSGLMSRIGGSAAAPGGLQGGALAGLAGRVGMAGLGLTAGLAGYGMLQQGGEMYQSYKNQGMVRGGGFAEGVSNEMSARIMAMDPFLSTDQSRQVIQAALTEGYTGKAHDMVTSFIASNLKEMNLSVAESVELLRKNVEEGGQSIEGLAMELSVIKGLSQDGARSMSDRMAGFAGVSSALIDAGVPGPTAGRAAMIAGEVWSDDQNLKGAFEHIVAGLSSSPQGQAMALALSGTTRPAGVMPGTEFARMDDGGNQATMAMLKRFAQDSMRQARGDFLNAARIFQQRLAGAGQQINMTTAQNMLEKLLSGEDFVGSATADVEQEISEQTTVQNRHPGSALLGGIVSTIATTASGIKDTVATAGTAIADAWNGEGGRIWGRFRELDERQKDRAAAVRSAFAPHNVPMMDKVIDQYGHSGFEVLDGDGNVVNYNPWNRKTMEGLSSGDYTLRARGSQGAGTPLSQVAQSGGLGGGSTARTEVSGTLRIEMDPSAQRSGLRAPSSVQLTPHEERANAGYGGATPNNAPPGEGPLTRGRRGW